MEITVRYAVEGLYVDRQKSNPHDKPEKWVRSWQTWIECSSIERVDAVLNNGMKLLAPNGYSGFSELRAVKITEKRDIIRHD